jgi:hypothetical protein
VNVKKESWIFLALIGAAFGLVLIARRPVVNLPGSVAGPLAESEQAWQMSQQALDDLQGYRSITDPRLDALEQSAYTQQSQQRMGLTTAWNPPYQGIEG